MSPPPHPPDRDPSTFPHPDGRSPHVTKVSTPIGSAAGPDTPNNPYPFLTPTDQPDELGRLGPYRVIELLGRGGMGFVFRAEDEGLRRPVALKVMRPEVAAEATSRERFLREGRAAAAVKSDHVITIYQVGEANGVPFLAMEYLEGLNLDDWLQAWWTTKQVPVPLPAILRVAKGLLKGLMAAHEKGLIHRDIKPANLWVESQTNRVKLLDFGLTRGGGSDQGITHTGQVLGTPAYMAPEQAQGLRVDARADLFSVGVVLYRMITGENPFQRETVFATLAALAMDDPPSTTSFENIPDALAELIDRMLSKNVADRPASASEALAVVLQVEQQALSGALAPSSPVPQPPPVWPKPPSAGGRVADGLPTQAPVPPTGPPPPPREGGALPDSHAATANKHRPHLRTTAFSLPRGPLPGQPVARKPQRRLRRYGALAIVLVAIGVGLAATASRYMGRTTPLPLDEVSETFDYVIDSETRHGTRRVVILDIGGGERMELIPIPKGSFSRGAPDNEARAKDEEKPQQAVEIGREFYLGKFEVTQAQYRVVTDQSPSKFPGDRLPVEQVSREDAAKFCTKVSARTGRALNLPTEAEWEYACRAGTKTPFHFGGKLNGDLANCKGTSPYGTDVKGADKKTTVAVGSYSANPWGLHDMHGNVWEWCQDHYAPYSVLAEAKDPLQLSVQLKGRCIIRGGSWYSTAEDCRAACRFWLAPTAHPDHCGFRVCLRLE